MDQNSKADLWKVINIISHIRKVFFLGLKAQKYQKVFFIQGKNYYEFCASALKTHSNVEQMLGDHEKCPRRAVL